MELYLETNFKSNVKEFRGGIPDGALGSAYGCPTAMYGLDTCDPSALLSSEGQMGPHIWPREEPGATVRGWDS